MGRRMRGLGWVLGWCSEWGLGGIGFRKKWGFPLGLLGIVLLGVKGWSSRLVLRLSRGLGCSRWGLLRIGDSWRVGLGLFGLVCAQSVGVLPVCSLRVSNVQWHQLEKNPRCRAGHTS